MNLHRYLLAETVPVLSSIFIPYSFFMGGLGVNAIFICIPLWMYNNNFMSEADVWDIFQFFSLAAQNTQQDFKQSFWFPYTAGACVKLIQSQSVMPKSSVPLAWYVMIFLAILTHTSFAIIIVSPTSLTQGRCCSVVHGLVWARTHFLLLFRRTAAVPIRERHFYC